ncbi:MULTISPECIES: hypothetical protein [Prochlorococcus]|uniref:Predicted endonuclease n=1 Tax=Prochlorococcus marinus (strain SARG / CCMP1375 / SS120) TaxID=167539 RepID=Q7VDT9_PROMA|nr:MULTISPECIES: hypothetical protein [Prochlorococcus]AAP99325.1 Predicted endonuclease [Prochlorococcus marinus subsp. marinus str. CCMP1375]KGG11403.1 hypothetical protein EV04_1482 [Prochlorococcus marinus str. LG]KGG18641.1 hypothetical protein EV08_1889 [Prochlorococcus marinus str. SS2]KGG22914.1 hypothetical protein EV09_1656 [Prochlorococcus marinus str. SS35]KGG34018.1 hypothetical protein EV10_0054 [Prochlorococcus marinus str. SS51]
MRKVISIDPGHKKCGILLADVEGLFVIDGKTVINSSVIKLIEDWREKYIIDLIIIGNGTTSRYWQGKFIDNEIGPIELVDERMTTLLARSRYLELCPPKFIFRWIPKTLIPPPANLDAVVALILIENYFGKKLEWKSPVELRIWP